MAVDVDRKTAVPVNAKYTHNGASGLMKSHCGNFNSDAHLHPEVGEAVYFLWVVFFLNFMQV